VIVKEEEAEKDYEVPHFSGLYSCPQEFAAFMQ